MHDFRLPPRCGWDLRSSGLFRSVEWWDRWVVPKHRYGITTLRYVITQKRADLSNKSFYPARANTSRQHHMCPWHLVNSMETVNIKLRCFRYLRHELTKCDPLVDLNTTSAASTNHQATFCEGSNQWSEARRDLCTHDPQLFVESTWNVMAHGAAREGKWRGNWRMECVASNLHTTLEHGVSTITTADVHTSAASSRLNWRPLPI